MVVRIFSFFDVNYFLFCYSKIMSSTLDVAKALKREATALKSQATHLENQAARMVSKEQADMEGGKKRRRAGSAMAKKSPKKKSTKRKTKK